MPSLSLVVAAGPDMGRRAAIGSSVTVGRGQGEALQLSDSAVSRHHLTLSAATDASGKPCASVDEVAGVNPVWMLVDGERVSVVAGASLAAGATITLGNTTLRVEEAKPAGARPGRPVGSGTVEMDATMVAGPEAPSRLSSLAALGDRLARCGSLQAVYREATAWAVAALPASRALLVSPDGSDVLAAAAESQRADLAISKVLLDRALKERRAFLVGDVLSEPDLADRRSVQVRGIVGAMAAPAEHLVFYVDWGIGEATRRAHDEDALLLLICAAHLVSALGQAAAERAQLAAAAKGRRSGTAGRHVPRMIGHSPAMSKLQVFIERVAASPATVLLHGESGTGKELAAGLIHDLSPRNEGPFVAINCAAIPEQLLESELFGHEKGAFTGAVAQHDGVFSRANGGTLFLDEIGEMSLPTQARMLRVLETQSFTRVGGTKEVKVSVRLVAATHRDLRAMVAAQQFREDLLYRLSVIQTELPPLRDREGDIQILVKHFCEALGDEIGRRVESIAPDALSVLTRYRWPGNVRELRNVVERALVLGDGPVLETDDLPPELLHAAPASASAPTVTAGVVVTPAAIRTLAELEREAIDAALAATGGNKARAAALLGIDRTTLYRKLKDHAGN